MNLSEIDSKQNMLSYALKAKKDYLHKFENVLTQSKPPTYIYIINELEQIIVTGSELDNNEYNKLIHKFNFKNIQLNVYLSNIELY